MFTGIIEGLGVVVAINRRGPNFSLTIDTKTVIIDPVIGESIACDGVCLTVTKINGTNLDFDVSAETIDRSTFGKIRIGGKVNLERALALGGRVGGHLVAGHVDRVGKIVGVVPVGAGYEIEIALDDAGMRYIIDKGSIAIAGISLTVARKKERSVIVAVIPHTMTATTLANAGPGIEVNVEYDMIGKYVENFVNPTRGGISLETLGRHGFV
jgi:riboflavin synthase